MSFLQTPLCNVVATQVEPNMFDIRSKDLVSAGGCLKKSSQTGWTGFSGIIKIARAGAQVQAQRLMIRTRRC